MNMNKSELKPICLIKICTEALFPAADKDMSSVTEVISDFFKSKIPDYNIVVLPIIGIYDVKSGKRDAVEVECLYEKDFVEEQKGYLEKLVKQYINVTQPKKVESQENY